jgi:hypothetical protein
MPAASDQVFQSDIQFVCVVHVHVDYFTVRSYEIPLDGHGQLCSG